MALYISTFTLPAQLQLRLDQGCTATAQGAVPPAQPLPQAYHRLDVEFDHAEPRLDDARSIPELGSKVQADHSISKAIDGIVRCMVASLFCFELDSIPERFDGKSVGMGHIQ
jgi:hypothetical protein